MRRTHKGALLNGRFAVPAIAGWIALNSVVAVGAAPILSLAFEAPTIADAKRWQGDCRDKLFELMMGGAKPKPIPLKPEVLRRIEMPAGGYMDRPRYLHWSDADAYADSIEGSLYLLSRLPTREGFDWLDKMLPLFLGKQRDNGIVEGWYGDGNYARTALLAALFHTQGATCQPWRADLRLGAARDGDTLHLVVSAEKEWEGRLRFDTPRHRENLGLPVNYARLNEFPEWFAVEAPSDYLLTVGTEKVRPVRGAELRNGVPVRVKAGQRVTVKIESPK